MECPPTDERTLQHGLGGGLGEVLSRRGLLRDVGEVTVRPGSPNASVLAYVASGFLDPADEDQHAEVRLLDRHAGSDRAIGRGHSPRWAPDGSRLAFVVGDDPGVCTLAVVSGLDSGGGPEITQFPIASEVRWPTWSPDATSIAYVRPVPTPVIDEVERSLPPPPDGVTRSRPVVIEDLHHRQDGIGDFVPRCFEHLFVLDLGTGEERQLTRGAWHVGARESGRVNADGGLTWAAGGTIVFDGHGPDADGDLLQRSSSVWSLDVATGGIRRLVPADAGGAVPWWRRPVVSPSGDLVAAVGYGWTERHVQLAERLLLVAVDGSRPPDVVFSPDALIDDVAWHVSGRSLLVSTRSGGRTELHRIDLGTPPTVTALSIDDDVSLTLDSGAFDRWVAAIRHGFRDPDEVCVIDLGAAALSAQTVTSVNARFLDGLRLGEVLRLDATASDGEPVTSWLVLPPEPAAPMPLIVTPDLAAGGPYFAQTMHAYASFGYAVLAVAYRSNQSAAGFGERRMNDGFDGFPNARVLADLDAGVDAALATGLIDPRRIFVAGSSQGGQVTAWAISHPHRFAAAAVLMPIVDPISDALTTDEALWTVRNYRNPPWSDPARWLEASTILRADRIDVPTLIIAGSRDLRTPVHQAEQLFAALKMTGRVPTRLVRLECGHDYHQNLADAWRVPLHVIGWFAAHDLAPRVQGASPPTFLRG